MNQPPIATRDLLQRTWTAIGAAPLAAVAYLVALSALGLFIDIGAPDAPGTYLLDLVASTVAGYFLLRTMLGKCGLIRAGEGGGFGAYFIVSLVSGLGIGLGILLLIVPGVILMARWQAATALVLCENEGVSDALGMSWAMTRGNSWPIFAVMLIGLSPLILLIVWFGLGSEFAGMWAEQASATYAELVIINLLVTVCSVFATALPVAVYWMLRREGGDIYEVFA